MPSLLPLSWSPASPDDRGEGALWPSHFDGHQYRNPWIPAPPPGQTPQRRPAWVWRYLFGHEWPAWPPAAETQPGPPPAAWAARGEILVTPVGHATFLIQIDGLNILTDPIWSDRCSPVSWAGPLRHRPPAIRFDELPPIDAVLISHNHYDHMDLPTLARLAERGVARAVVPLGNRELVRQTGIPDVQERDWWQPAALSAQLTATLVPAQHFSSRSLWDRNETLWGGYVLSGPSGHLFFAGDTGYGPHFRAIAGRFSPLRAAILPISPFRPQPAGAPPTPPSVMHMGPAEAVQAHLDLGATLSIAAHHQVFQLGADGFDDAVDGLAAALRERGLRQQDFVAPPAGRAIALPPRHPALPLAAAEDARPQPGREPPIPFVLPRIP